MCELSKLSSGTLSIRPTGDRFGTTRMCSTDKMLEQHRVLSVIPVA